MRMPLVDDAASHLHALGYSFGHHASISRDGGDLHYTVYAHKGEHRIVVHRPTLAAAYLAAVEQAE